MERNELIEHFTIILREESWQCSKNRTIQSSIRNQRSSINAIAKAMNIRKLTKREVENLSIEDAQ